MSEPCDPLIFPSVDGGIVAGGLGRRMGGINKGLVSFRSKPMVQWVSDAIRPFVQSLYINCNQDARTYAEFGDGTCADDISDYPGPLAGLASLLRCGTGDYMLISPCDTPFLNATFAQTMLGALNKDIELNQKPLNVYCASMADRVHPLHCLLHRSVLSSLEDALLAKEFRVMDWLQSHPLSIVEFQPSKLFINVNRPEDIAE